MKTRPDTQFSERLRQRRAAAGLTQRQLAEKAGISQPVLSQYETGQTSPGLAALQALLRALGAEAGELLG